MKHEVTAIDVFHDKEEMLFGLETRVQPRQKWRLLLEGKYLAFVQSAFNVILLDNEVLFKTLDCIDLLRGLVLSQKHLKKEELSIDIKSQLIPSQLSTIRTSELSSPSFTLLAYKIRAEPIHTSSQYWD